MNPDYLKELIQRYLNGTVTDAEKQELLSWYHLDSDETFKMPYRNEKEANEAEERLLSSIRQKTGLKQRLKIEKSHRAVIRWAAAAAVLLIGVFVFYELKMTTKSTVLVSTQVGQRKIVRLSDGSTVWLSAKSRIQFLTKFSDTRDVYLSGEAFFDVAKDKNHPFIVHTGQLTTKVLGTTFNVSAYQEHKTVSVALLTGKVAFSDGHMQVQLTPDHQVTYDNKTRRYNFSIISDPGLLIARRNGYYEYKNIRVKDIAEDLSRNFNTDIRVEGKVSDCLFYGRLNAGESVDQFVRKMAMIVNARVKKTNNGYLITGGGCL